ncbi:MAG: hypothetical protein FD153_788 [Rhodospirillaceae bacterium]|nr:MAG: hypothetical protein FD153_788 [Rhodospirillaceae bacterium]
MDSWSLTSGIRAGGAGSVDLRSAAIIYCGFLTSHYIIPKDDYEFSITNIESYYKTEGISIGGYSIDYDLANQVIKNGVGAEGPPGFSIMDMPVAWEFNAAHTAFFGDAISVNQYLDVTLGLRAQSVLPGGSRPAPGYHLH